MVGSAARQDTRSTIVEVAARMLHERGPAAVTTRAVARAAGVQAPAIYRLFGDKDGLLEAVAQHVLTAFVAEKAAVVDQVTASGGDPLVDLRRGWESQIEFGLANPSLFALVNAPDSGMSSAVGRQGVEVLRTRVRRVAAAGRLRVSEDRAIGLIRASGAGAVLTMLTTSVESRDLGLADSMWDALTRAILTDVPTLEIDDVAAATITFRTIVPRLHDLSDSERALMTEWLDRAIGS